jgi:hypothetical protein
MTDEDLIVDLNRLCWLLEEDRQYRSRAGTAKAAADRIETQAVEIERLLGDLERVLSVAKEIEKACRGLRDEAQPMTAKDAARLIIAALTGAKP